MRYRARVAYDGTDFLGWQTQSGRGRTVQEALNRAFSTVLRGPIEVEGAGRTDSGVHATGQVIAFDANTELSEARIVRSVNALLPDDVAVRGLEVVGEGFDPRRHAVRRAYLYRIWNAPERSPVERRTSWHVPWKLDLDRLQAAAQQFVGIHDFASFQGADKIPRPSIREVERSGFEADGALLTYRIEANAFARHMVRNIVGQLVEVGQARCSLEQLGEILAACDRTRASAPAPPEGLFLERVDYE